MGQSSSDLFAAGAHLGKDGIDAVLVDRAQRVHGETQLHPTVLRGDPEAALVQVGKETAAGLVVRMRDVVARLHALAGHLANSAHGRTPGSVGTVRSPDGGGPATSGRSPRWHAMRDDTDAPARPGIAFPEPSRPMACRASRALCLCIPVLTTRQSASATTGRDRHGRVKSNQINELTISVVPVVSGRGQTALRRVSATAGPCAS